MVWRTLFRRLKIIGEMIKIEHTLFALPFAFMGAFLGAGGLPSLRVCGLVLLAMVGGRSAAMAFNRLADAELDKGNPRTWNRALPAGILKKGDVALFTVLSAALFLFAAWMLNPLCFALAWPVLFILLAYSYAKRFTWLCHFILGLCLGMTPLAGWIAVTGAFDAVPLVLSLGVLFWTAGFDVIYACQDYGVDKRDRLFSIPVRFGMKGALVLSAALHLVTLGLFAVTGWMAALGWPYWAALAVTAVLLVYEHAIVKPTDLTRVNAAFFTANGVISMAMAAGTYLAL